MVKVIKSGLSKKLQELLLNWTKEEEYNRQHDIEENFAWNILVCYLMEIEHGSKDSGD